MPKVKIVKCQPKLKGGGGDSVTFRKGVGSKPPRNNREVCTVLHTRGEGSEEEGWNSVVRGSGVVHTDHGIVWIFVRGD